MIPYPCLSPSILPLHHHLNLEGFTSVRTESANDTLMDRRRDKGGFPRTQVQLPDAQLQLALEHWLQPPMVVVCLGWCGWLEFVMMLA